MLRDWVGLLRYPPGRRLISISTKFLVGNHGSEPAGMDNSSSSKQYLTKAYYVLGVVTVLNVINLWHRYLLVSGSVWVSSIV